MSTIDCESLEPNGWPQKMTVRQIHTLRADVDPASGSTDSAPGPHDYFDGALASCKALTALWYAKHNNIPLDRVETHVDRDNADEKKGTYRLNVRIVFHGEQLTAEHKQRLYAAVARCPIHKLMTTTDVVIETAPL